MTRGWYWPDRHLVTARCPRVRRRHAAWSIIAAYWAVVLLSLWVFR